MPSESHFEPCSQRYGLFLVLWLSAFGGSGGLFGPFPGHIMELKGCKELVDTGKSSCTWRVPTISLRLAVLNVFQGLFGPKNGCFWPQTAVFETGPRHLRIPFRAATVEFLAQTLCDCTSHPSVSCTKLSSKSKTPRRRSDFSPFRACCLLVAKPGRSTLDTKKGYKTKTGSTSSVT